MAGETGKDSRPDSVRGLKFGQIAVKLSFITQAQLDEALDIQQKMAQMGIHETIGEILVKKGYLTQQACSQVLKHMGVPVQPIPGYQILAKLGQGGMGTVYKARQLSMDRIVALKVLSPEATSQPNYIERFFREAQSAAKLNHRNIIQAYDAGAAGGMYYFAMEFVEGKTCREILQSKGPFPERQALNIVLQVAEALEYIAGHKLIHRDIKPENIMLTADGTVKVCDFGLARSQQVDSSVTRAGFTFGTPYYMSPEQINGEKNLDIRSDLYSLGATMYHLLTGRVPFEGKELRAVLAKHLTQDPPDPRQLVPTLSSHTVTVLFKLLAKDRSQRYQTPRELIQDLKQVLGGAQPVHAPSLRRRRRRTGLVVAGAVAAAVLAAAGLGLALMGGVPPLKPQAGSPPADDRKPDVNEVNAKDLLHRARVAFEKRRWDDALAALSELEQKYKATRLYDEHSAEIVKLQSDAQEQKDEEDRRKATAELQQVQRVREIYARAERAFRDGRWQDARKEYEALLQEKTPVPDVEPQTISLKLELVKKEIEAGDRLRELNRLAAEKNWPGVRAAYELLRANFGQTQTFRDAEVELRLLDARCRREIEARAAFAAIEVEAGRCDADPGRWPAVQAQIAEFRRTYNGTEVLQTEDQKLAEWDRRAFAYLETAEKAKREEEALGLWNKSDVAFKAGNFEDAKAALEELAQKYFATETYRKYEQEVRERLSKIGDEQKRTVEGRASAEYSRIRKLYDQQAYETALRALQALQQSYGDTQYVQTRQGEIRRMIEACQREIQRGVVVIEDFEAGVGRWVAQSNGERPTMREDTDTPSVTSPGKSGQFTWVPHRGTYSMAVLNLPNQLHPDTVALSLWVRSDDRKTNRIRIQLREGPPDQEEVWAVERDIPASWTQIKILLREFKCIYKRNNRIQNPELDLERVRTLAFSQPTSSLGLSIVVDQIRAELKSR